jgi:hypothetical protein
MALAVRAGAFNIGTAAAGNTTNLAHGLSTTPKGIITWWSGRTESTDTAAALTSRRGMGLSDGTNHRAASNYDQDAVGTAVTSHVFRTDACISNLTDATNNGLADVQSWDGTNVVFEILTQFTIDLRVSYLVFGGDDITNVEVGSFTATGTAPINQTVNNSGNFPPDITFFLGAQATSANTAGADSGLCFGVAKDSTLERVWFGGSQDAATSAATGTYCRSGECYAMAGATGNPATSPTARAEFVSHNASPGGFTINWLERNSAHLIAYMSIKGGQWSIGDFLTLTSVTTVAETGVGFPPDAALLVSGGAAETVADATPTPDDRWSVGAQTRVNSDITGQGVCSRDGNTSMFVSCAVDADESYVGFNAVTQAIEAAGKISTFDSDGFTWSQTDAETSIQKFAWYVALAANAVAGGRTTKNTRLRSVWASG